MTVQGHPSRLTYDDLVLLPDDRLRHEVLDGQHYTSTTPPVRHQLVSMQLTAILAPFVIRHRLGLLLSAPSDVVLSESDIVVPDFAFVSKERLDIVTPANIQGAPDLLIEILSPGTKRVDQGVKLARYERFGIQEYWIVDPDRNKRDGVPSGRGAVPDGRGARGGSGGRVADAAFAGVGDRIGRSLRLTSSAESQAQT